MSSAITGFVLAGGKSSRMGSDKALLRLASGETLVEHSLALLATVTPEVRLLGSRERYAALAWAGPIIEDIYPGRGPLGGIHAGLKSSQTELNLVLAVDMPRMTSVCLRYLIDRATKSKALVVVPDINGTQQPLCAVYRRKFHEIAEKSLLAGNYRVNGVFEPQSTLVIRADELVAAGFGPELFDNLNTSDEWTRFSESHPQTK